MRCLSISGLVLALLVPMLFCPHLRRRVPPLPPADFVLPQSPTKPEPFPIKMVDQGQFDPALKGYYLPEGFKLEIVINEPDTINPVGMTFAPGRHAVRHGVAARPGHRRPVVRGEGDIPLQATARPARSRR